MLRFIWSCMLIAAAGAALGQKEKLERLTDYYAAHDHFNGTVLVARKGGILLSKSYGTGDDRTHALNTEGTMYLLGSNTSQFTAEMIVQLDSKGHLGLEDRINKYFPEYAHGSAITLKQLLTHTSGIPDYTHDPTFMQYAARRAVNRDDILNRLKIAPPAFAPGASWAFSTSDYFLLALVTEHITQKKYDRAIRENIFLACDMRRSGADYLTQTDPYKARGYYLAPGGRLTEAPPADTALTYGWGNVYTTAGDLLKWHRALLHHKLLPKDWQDLAYLPIDHEHALGWDIFTRHNRRFAGQEGSAPGFSNYIARQEDDDLLVVVLENVTRSGETDAGIAAGILACLYDKNYVLPGDRKAAATPEKVMAPPAPAAATPAAEGKAHKDKAVSATVLKRYTGTFEINPALTITFQLVGNELYASTQEHSAIAMIPETETLFRAEGLNAKIEFVKNGTQPVNKIVLHQQGALVPAVRAK